LFDEGIEFVTVDEDPTRRTANAKTGFRIALHGQTHNVQGSALQQAVYGVDADAQVRSCGFSIEQSWCEAGRTCPVRAGMARNPRAAVCTDLKPHWITVMTHPAEIPS
jgi:hypothetical protein